MKLGRYPELTLGKAREKAKTARAELTEGKDPGKDLGRAQCVADLVEDYLKRHAATLRSHDEIARRLRKNVKDVIGAVRLAELHRRDITRCIDAIKDRGAGIEANRVFEDLRAMVKWARGRGDLDTNLTEGMKKPTVTVERDRALAPAEIHTVWDRLRAAEMWEGTRNVLRLCLVTAQRPGEVCGMTRPELDLRAAIWTIPPERAKNGLQHTVPLSDLALAIIREQMAAVEALARRKGRAVPKFIFPAPGARAAMAEAAVPKAVKREETQTGKVVLTMGIAPWQPRDLRRTAATMMEELGVSPIIIGHVLNHESTKRATITSRVYARYDYSREKREALTVYAGRLADIIAGCDIIPILGDAA